MSICGKTTTLIFLDLELVHHFIDRKLVVQSSKPIQHQPTSHLSLVTSSEVLLPLQVQVQVILRPTVSRPVCLGVGPSSGAHDQICITVGHLRSSCFASSLTRGWVCNLLVQLAATLRSKSCRTHDHILLSHLRPYITVSYETPPPWRARSLHLYPPWTGWPSYTPGHWVPFLSPLTISRATVRVF
jgi:hypothetical protein